MEHFEKLFKIDCSEKVETKKSGGVELNYLSWAYAWGEVKKIYPNAQYDIIKFGEKKLPYVYDENTGYMVFTIVEIEGLEHEMWLPVMDSSNKAMKSEPYEYKVKKYSYGKWTGEYEIKRVEAATMFDINKTIMRCLTKNLAMFGLGLYIYAGEDLPESEKNKNDEIENKEQSEKATKPQIALIEKLDDETKKKLTNKYKIKEINELTKKDASEIISNIKGIFGIYSPSKEFAWKGGK